MKNKKKVTTACSHDANEILDFIKKAEKMHEDELRNLYLGMGDLVKGIRRQLPVTGKKFEWNTSLMKLRGFLGR